MVPSGEKSQRQPCQFYLQRNCFPSDTAWDLEPWCPVPSHLGVLHTPSPHPGRPQLFRASDNWGPFTSSRHKPRRTLKPPDAGDVLNGPHHQLRIRESEANLDTYRTRVLG